jgi:hypothetical protein
MIIERNGRYHVQISGDQRLDEIEKWLIDNSLISPDYCKTDRTRYDFYFRANYGFYVEFQSEEKAIEFWNLYGVGRI